LEVSFLDISDRSCGVPGPVQRFASSHRVLRSLRSLPGAVRPAGPHRPLS
jgi:hypothetical protein